MRRFRLQIRPPNRYGPFVAFRVVWNEDVVFRLGIFVCVVVVVQAIRCRGRDYFFDPTSREQH